MDLTTATPVEIDTRLEALYEQRFAAAAQSARLAGYIMSAVEMRFATDKPQWRETRVVGTLADALAAIAKGENGKGEALRSYEVSSVQGTVERYNAAKAEVVRLDAEMAPLHAEFRRRGGWTRAYLVLNNNGHVHSSMNCSTCFEPRWDDVTGEYREGTRYGWLPSLSGHDEAEIVAKAGADACTVCYPSAPVETAGARVILHHTEEEAARIKAEKAAEKAAKAAAKQAKAEADDLRCVVTLTAEDAGYDYRNGISTIRKARSFLTDGESWNWNHPYYNATDRDSVAGALAARQGTDAATEIAAAAKRAAKRR